MESPLISVVMPVYNGAPYLQQAIASVEGQSLQAEIELVAVDDCSLDNSRELLFACKQQFTKLSITVIAMEKNMGAAACRNAGVRAARGRYIAFLDCDDWWENEKLKAQLDILEKTNCPVCCTAREFAEADGSLTGKIVPVADKISYNMLLRSNSIALSSAMLLRDTALKYPQGNDDCHEDYIMWLAILKNCGDARGINKPYLKYRKSPNAKSGNKLRSAVMHYKSLRVAGIGRLKAVGLFAAYAFYGLKNHGGI